MAAQPGVSGGDSSAAAAAPRKEKVVYVGFAGDLIHHGHINIINEARKLGHVIIGLLTDEAIATYKRETIVKYPDRKFVAERLRGVGEVVPQLALDYSENLLKYRPDFVVHGTDWRNGPQAKTRQRVIDLLATWGGVVVEPEYTKDVSTTDIIRKCFEYEKQRKEGRELSTEELARWEELKEARQVVPPDMALEPPLLARITAARPLVYVAVSNDFIHHGHVRIISEAAKLGTVVVALLTDGAVEALKGSSPVTPFAHRRVVFEAVNNVSFVIAQASPDYTHNLQMLRPEFVVHGDDWRDGPQRVIRLRVEAQLREWGGRLIEPKYTELALADSIIDTCYDRVSKQQEKQQKASAQ